MSTVLEATLRRLANARGVEAVALFDETGACLASEGSPNILGVLGAAAARVSAGASEGEIAATTREALGRTHGGVTVRCLTQSTLVVISEPGTDLGISGLGFHIAVAARVIEIRSSRPPLASSN